MTTSVIAGRYVLGMKEGAQVLLRDHYVYVDGTSIEAVTPDAPAAGTPVVRYEHGLVTPGFVNLHAHCIRGGLFRGIPDDLEMEPWVPKLVYNILLPLTALAAKELTADELRAVTALGMIDLLKGGTTTVLDMWHHGQEVFFDVAREKSACARWARRSSCLRRTPASGRTATRSGISATTAWRSLPSRSRSSRRATRDATVSPRWRSARTPPTPACPDLLRECRKAADDLGCLLTTHFAQTPQELALLRKRYGMGAAEYARDTGLLGERVILAHAGCATDEELGVLAATGTHVANCAYSFAREGMNFPYARFAKAGINTGIGTDSIGMDIVSELRINGLLSKQFFGKAHVGTAHELVRAATLAGGQGARPSRPRTHRGRCEGRPPGLRPAQAAPAAGVGPDQEPRLEGQRRRHGVCDGPRQARGARRTAAHDGREPSHADCCSRSPQDLEGGRGAGHPAGDAGLSDAQAPCGFRAGHM